MALTKIAVSLAVRNPKIDSFSTYLFIGPHPDDIEIGAGATVSRLTALGKKVVFLICTDGRYGTENLSSPLSTDALIEVRKKECIASAKVLGVSDVRFLNLPDGNGYTQKVLLEGIANTIHDVQPDVIFAPDPDVESECHADHLNVGRACKELANFANYKDIFAGYLSFAPTKDVNIQAICLYMTAKPNAFIKTSGHFQKQTEAILCHATQYPENHPATASVMLYLKLRSIEFGLRRFHKSSEGFRMMNRTRMHCLPEASL